MTGKRVALVIGNNYPNSDKELKFAVSDAEKMKEILENKDICGFDEISYYLDKESREVSIAVNKILSKADNDLVFIYYSGHGKKDHEGKLCLLFNDTDEEVLVATSLSFDFIQKCIDYPNKKSVVIVLDCCYSGAAGIKDADIDMMDSLRKLSGSGTVVLTSTGTTGSSKAREDEKLGHGIFTYYLIEGLEKGYADQNEDGLISIDELYDYAYKKTTENSTQSPKREGRIEGTFLIGTYPQKVREKEYEAKKKKLFEFRNVLHFNIYDKCQTILRKSYKTPSLLTEDDNFILNYLEKFLKDCLLPEQREDIKQDLIEVIQLVEKDEQERKSREEEKTRNEEEKARKEKEEQERKQREEEKARKEKEEQERKQREEEKARKVREEQKRKEEERKNLLSTVKKPIESGSKMAYERPMGDEDWNRLLQRIKDGKCTPFLGAGVSAGKIPVGSQIANEWAKKYRYPMEDSYDLARVAKYVAVTEEDEMFPREEICKRINEQLKEVAPKYFEIPDEIHGVLAELPLPVYITTNYDDLMVRALKSRGKTPNQEICRWNKVLMQRKRTSSDFVPTPEKPLVYHLHGYYEIPESLVLTEDDYQDFLVAISKEQSLLPPRIQQAFTDSSFLFLGYRIDDWDFRSLLRILTGYLKRRRRKHLSVQFMPGYVSETQKEEVQKYLDRYFDELDIHVYWQDCREFARELRTRWEAFNRGN